jgi:AraC-like DNA-binding protein
MSLRMIGNHSLPPQWEDEDPAPELVAEVAYVALAGPDYRAQWPLQALPGYELAYVREGVLHLWLGEQRLVAEAGEALVVPPRTPHREETPAGATSDVIYLGASLRGAGGRERLFPLPLAPVVSLGRGHVVEQRLLQVAAELQARQAGYTRLVSEAVLEVFWHLARATRGLPSPTPTLSEWPTLSTFAPDVQDYLTRHHAEDLSMDEVARHFHLSRQYFTRLCRSLLGETPHAYLTRVRIQQACRLLGESALPVKTVAARVGYRDPNYFARAFTVHTGLTPTQYRRQREAESPGR